MPYALPSSKLTCRSPCVLSDSPWVCNCGHPWAAHSQSVHEVAISSVFAQMMESADMTAEAASVMATALDAGGAEDLTLDYRRDGVTDL